MKPEPKKSDRSSISLLVIGTALFIFYYIADCALDSVVFGEGTFAGHLFAPTAHEVAIRVLSGTFLFALYVISTVLIHRNKALQRELLQKTAEILIKNREVDTYNQTLSMDLRSTLTRVMLANQRLQFDCYRCSTQRCRERLLELTTNCERLSAEFSGMLNYSDAIRSELNKSRVAIGNLASEIAAGLSEKNRGTTLNFEIDNNVETDCDPDLMRIALRKLIDSSLNFMPRQQAENIRFGVTKRKGVPIFYVGGHGADQEPDMDPTDRDDLSLSLHTPISIRTAREIIERHGGHLWSRNHGDAPPTYYFTLTKDS